jgi:hypothetical protein
MLLHNLYWLVFEDQIPYNYYVTTNFPENTGGFGSDFDPAVITASNKILANNTLYPDANAKYIAQNEVDLLPGFDSQTGSEFEAYTIGNGTSNTQFKKIQPSYGCNQKSIPAYKNVSKDSLNTAKTENDLLTSNKVRFKIYPNPSNGFTNFYYSESNAADIEILNLQGSLLYQKKILTHDLFTDLRFLQPGVYVVRLITPENIITEKLIIQY